MIEIRETETFSAWLRALRDDRAKANIAVRFRRHSLGNTRDVKRVGEGVSELRVHHGAGYRVYFVQRGTVLIVLLCGGDKATQDKDIATAKTLARETP
jgi:putative addiction module killer protein